MNNAQQHLKSKFIDHLTDKIHDIFYHDINDFFIDYSLSDDEIDFLMDTLKNIKLIYKDSQV